MSDGDDAIIARAQRTLEARRAELGSVPRHKEPARLASVSPSGARVDHDGADPFLQWARSIKTDRSTCAACMMPLVDHPTETCKVARFESVTDPRCAACGARIEGVGFCKTCFAASERKDRRVHIDRYLRQIPERFRWASLDAPDLARRCGERSIAAAREFRGRLLVLRGSTTAGKTSLASALARYEIEQGKELWWIECEEISPDAPRQDRAHVLVARAMSASPIVLDDIGQDLSGAPEGGGIAAIRGERARRIVRHRHKKGYRTIVTCGLTDDQIDKGYGSDITARLTEPTDDSLVIRMYTPLERAGTDRR